MPLYMYFISTSNLYGYFISIWVLHIYSVEDQKEVVRNLRDIGET